MLVLTTSPLWNIKRGVKIFLSRWNCLLDIFAQPFPCQVACNANHTMIINYLGIFVYRIVCWNISLVLEVIFYFAIFLFSAKRSWCASSTCRIFNRKSGRRVCSLSGSCVNYPYFYTLVVGRVKMVLNWLLGGKRTLVMRASKARWTRMKRKRFLLTWRSFTLNNWVWWKGCYYDSSWWSKDWL